MVGKAEGVTVASSSVYQTHVAASVAFTTIADFKVEHSTEPE